MVARVAGVCFALTMVLGIWLAGRGIGPAWASSRSVYLPFVPVGLTQFFDDFSNPSSGWPTGSDANVQFGYLNGEYQVYFLQPSLFAVTPGVSSTGFTVQADARLANSNSGGYGLAFDIAADWSSFYAFIVEPFSQTAAIAKNVNGAWTNLTNWETISGINSGQGSNHLAVVRNGSSIQTYVNNAQANFTSNSDLQTGRIGLYAQTDASTSNVDVRFDNFDVGGIAQISSLTIGTSRASGYSAPTSGALANPGVHSGTEVDTPLK